MFERFDAYDVVFMNIRARFVDVHAIHENTSRHDQRLRLRSRVDETTLDEGDVETLLFHSERTVKPSCRK